jgi:carbon-monoxide dehydrogenase small subunit
MDIELTVNGQPVTAEIPPQELLLDFLRNRLALTGAKRSCEVQVCGTCTVLVDGQPVSSCCTLAYEARGRAVTTIEGLAAEEGFRPLEEAFVRHAALQCGFCTPGFLVAVKALLDAGELRTDEEIARNLSGNVCRCTGYKGIIEAVRGLGRAAA